jgi:hypothetical protein
MSDQVTRTYGRGAFLAFLSPLPAFLMARRGMDGLAQRAEAEVQRDVLAMEDKGYRVVSADEYRLPVLGIAWFRVVYERRT